MSTGEDDARAVAAEAPVWRHTPPDVARAMQAVHEAERGSAPVRGDSPAIDREAGGVRPSSVLDRVAAKKAEKQRARGSAATRGRRPSLRIRTTRKASAGPSGRDAHIDARAAQLERILAAMASDPTPVPADPEPRLATVTTQKAADAVRGPREQAAGPATAGPAVPDLPAADTTSRDPGVRGLAVSVSADR